MHVHLVTHPYASTHASTSEQRQVGVCCNQAACEREHAGGGSMLLTCVSCRNDTGSRSLASSFTAPRCGNTRSCAWSSYPPLFSRCPPRSTPGRKPGGSVCTNCLGMSSLSPKPLCTFFFNPRGLCVPVYMRVRVQADVCTAPLTLQMIRPCLFFVCFCQACTAFVFFPATTRLPLRRVQRPCEPRAAAAATARTPPAETRGWTTRSVGRRPQLLSSSIGGVGEGNVAVGGAGAAPEDDPFRPERASVSPMVINAIVSVLFKHVRRSMCTTPANSCVLVSANTCVWVFCTYT